MVQRVGDTRLKIYLYHIPPVAIVGVTPKLVERLLKAYPNAIAGMKDSSGDWNNTKTFLDAFAETAHAARTFDVFVGSESFLLANMRNGGVGTISATANVNPAAIHALYQIAKRQVPNPKHQGSPKDQRSKQHQASALQRGREDESNIDHQTSKMERQQADLNVVREIFSNSRFPSMIATLKQAIALYGNDPKWTRVRPPLVELTPDQARTLAADLKAIGFAMPGIGRV